MQLVVIVLSNVDRLTIFHKHVDITTTNEGLLILGLYSAPVASEQRRIFIAQHLLWRSESFPYSSERFSKGTLDIDFQLHIRCS
jgi:hypothetical protein